MNWKDTLNTLAPTVATALMGPLGRAAVAAIGSVLGISQPTQQAIAKAISTGQLTSEQVSAIQTLELQYQNEEKERGFKYADLAFQDRDSARKANVAGGTQLYLFWLTICLLAVTLGSELYVLMHGAPKDVPDIIIGRILGLMDAIAMMVLTYWYGTTSSSKTKDDTISSLTKPT